MYSLNPKGRTSHEICPAVFEQISGVLIEQAKRSVTTPQGHSTGKPDPRNLQVLKLIILSKKEICF